MSEITRTPLELAQLLATWLEDDLREHYLNPLIRESVAKNAEIERLNSLNAFIGERFVQESLRADGRMKSVPAESDLEVALKSQIEICNKERGIKETAERKLAEYTETLEKAGAKKLEV